MGKVRSYLAKVQYPMPIPVVVTIYAEFLPCQCHGSPSPLSPGARGVMWCCDESAMATSPMTIATVVPARVVADLSGGGGLGVDDSSGEVHPAPLASVFIHLTRETLSATSHARDNERRKPGNPFRR
jgi:hypothetical protein